MATNEVNYNASPDIPKLAMPYLSRKESFEKLAELQSPIDLNVAVYCLNKNNSFLYFLKDNIPSHRKILKKWISEKYSNFLLLKRYHLDTEDLLELYLYLKFSEEAKGQNTITLMRGYDKEITFSYRYSTKKGETISYFDKVLCVPVMLKICADVKIKIVDSEKLMEGIDISVKNVDLKYTSIHMDTIVGKACRDGIIELINQYNYSYYDLLQRFSEINEVLTDKLNFLLADCGMSAALVNVLEISVLNDVIEMYEKQMIAIAEAERLKNYEYRMESKALDLYERKAEIHNRYPEYPLSLTESEKDFALNRFLRRNGENVDLFTDLENEELTLRAKQGDGTKTREPVGNDQPPALPEPTKNTFKTVYFILLSLALLTDVILTFALYLGAGLIAFGCTAFLFGMIAVLKYNSFNKPRVSAKDFAEHKRQMEVYLKNKYSNDAEREEI